MSSSLADDPTKDIVIYVNDFFPEFASGLTKLSQKLGRPLRGITLIDAERKASGNYRTIEKSPFEEVVVDFSDDAALRKALKPLEERLLLISCDLEQSQLYFKRVIPHVPYVDTPTESSLDFCTDKGKMREMLLSYDQAISPKAIVVHDVTLESVGKICAGLEFPLIVKPTNLAASLLVDKVNNEDELRRVLKRNFVSLNKIYAQHRGLGNKTMIVEEFVEGDVYSTDVYVDAIGKVYVLPFIHLQNGSMVGMDSYQIYQVETYLTLTEQELRQGVIAAEKAVHAVGLRSSVAHVELFHTAHGWKIIELGARPGGWRQEIYEISYGIDHTFNGLLIKIGLAPDMPSELKTHSTVFRVHAPKVGIVDSIMGIEEARRHPQIHIVRVNSKPGDMALPSTYGGEELVDGLMQNPDHEQLGQDVRFIRSIIKVNIRPNEPDIANE